jgi:hypothetical protein
MHNRRRQLFGLIPAAASPLSRDPKSHITLPPIASAKSATGTVPNFGSFRGIVGTAVNPGLDDMGIGARGPTAVGVFSAMTQTPKQFTHRRRHSCETKVSEFGRANYSIVVVKQKGVKQPEFRSVQSETASAIWDSLMEAPQQIPQISETYSQCVPPVSSPSAQLCVRSVPLPLWL